MSMMKIKKNILWILYSVVSDQNYENIFKNVVWVFCVGISDLKTKNKLRKGNKKEYCIHFMFLISNQNYENCMNFLPPSTCLLEHEQIL